MRDERGEPILALPIFEEPHERSVAWADKQGDSSVSTTVFRVAFRLGKSWTIADPSPINPSSRRMNARN